MELDEDHSIGGSGMVYNEVACPYCGLEYSKGTTEDFSGNEYEYLEAQCECVEKIDSGELTLCNGCNKLATLADEEESMYLCEECATPQDREEFNFKKI